MLGGGLSEVENDSRRDFDVVHEAVHREEDTAPAGVGLGKAEVGNLNNVISDIEPHAHARANFGLDPSTKRVGSAPVWEKFPIPPSPGSASNCFI